VDSDKQTDKQTVMLTTILCHTPTGGKVTGKKSSTALIHSQTTRLLGEMAFSHSAVCRQIRAACYVSSTNAKWTSGENDPGQHQRRTCSYLQKTTIRRTNAKKHRILAVTRDCHIKPRIFRQMLNDTENQ